MNKITDLFLKILKAICFICISGLVTIVTIQILSRAMKISWPWTEELSRFMLIWLTFAGSSVAVAQKSQLAVNYFVDLTKGNVNKGLKLFSQIAVVIFYIIITYYGFTLSTKTMNVLSPTMGWKMGLVYSILPITSLMTLFILASMIFNKGGEEI